MDKKICVLFSDGVEEIELITPVDIFRRHGINTTLVSAKLDTVVTGAHGIKIIADGTITSVDFEDFDVLVLPGGPSSFTLDTDENVVSVVRKFHDHRKLICAICAAPLILHNAGVLENKEFTAHPCTYGILKAAKQDVEVVVDTWLITAKGPGVAADFAFTIIDNICGNYVSKAMREELFF